MTLRVTLVEVTLKGLLCGESNGRKRQTMFKAIRSWEAMGEVAQRSDMAVGMRHLRSNGRAIPSVKQNGKQREGQRSQGAPHHLQSNAKHGKQQEG